MFCLDLLLLSHRESGSAVIGIRVGWSKVSRQENIKANGRIRVKFF